MFHKLLIVSYHVTSMQYKHIKCDLMSVYRLLQPLLLITLSTGVIRISSIKQKDLSHSNRENTTTPIDELFE